LLFSHGVPLRATLGFITPNIIQYLTTIVIQFRRADSCYSYLSVSNNNCYSIPSCRFVLLLVLLLLKSFSIKQQLLFCLVAPLRATLGFITAKILQYLTTIVILSRRAASCYSYPSVSNNNCYSVPACRFVLLLVLLLLESFSIYQQLLFSHVGPLRATLGFITPKILQYLTTIVIQSRRAASCYSWFYYS
jgi:hypothetical protein